VKEGISERSNKVSPPTNPRVLRYLRFQAKKGGPEVEERRVKSWGEKHVAKAHQKCKVEGKCLLSGTKN